MSPPTVAMTIAVGGFAIATGMNDGGTLVAAFINIPTVRPPMAVFVLTISIVAAPHILGTDVATRLGQDLVLTRGGSSELLLVGALTAAVGTVSVLARFGIPTSLTLALVGGLTGAALALSVPVSWSSLIFVLMMAAVAPVVGAFLGYLIVRFLRSVPHRGAASRRLARLHGTGVGLLALAYSANDGQKVLAVFAVALGTSGRVEPRWEVMVAIGALFAVGCLIGVRRVAPTLASGIMLARPIHIVSAEMSASIAVLGSTVVGAPVSMTQAIAAALVGSGASEGHGRIRWLRARAIAMAWLSTLPMATIAGATVTVLTASLLT